MTTAFALELLKTRAFLMKQEGLKRRGSLDAIQRLDGPPGYHPFPEYVALMSAGIRMLAHMDSGASLDELVKSRAYADMTTLEAAFNITG